MSKKKNILYGVFDWGLGHATRSKPLITALLERGHKVEFITTGRALKVLQQHFGTECSYRDVPSIVSPYTDKENFALNFALSTPKMLASLSRARKISKKIIKDNDYDIVISDCRYDVYGKRKNSYLINHQLRFAAPTGTETFVEAWLAYRMERYHRIIVPDYKSSKYNLSGRLSHKMKLIPKKRIVYIGHLSQLKKKKNVNKDIDYFITLTGPEPQRSILEKKVFKQAGKLSGRVVIAGGNPDKQKVEIPENVEYYPYLGTEEMEEMMNRTKFFISRSGYTSMMELAETGIEKALLIPTPGQTEQEYLAEYYSKQGFFSCVDQKNLHLRKNIKQAKDFKGFQPPWDTEQSVKNFLEVVGA